ncbi:MAG TPA: helix-turn-helix transcriptional regulator [Thermoanaerobaculia bacterium]|nr:helix-turn-helix transcriptional regulator [Thermoanaerobaculia bacterium]
MTKHDEVAREEAVDVRFVPQALRRVRQATGFLQVDVAEKSGLTRAMVSAYEAGKSIPSLRSLSVYLGAIGRDLGDLQDEVNRLSGRSSEEPLQDRERAVGRTVLKALRVLGWDLVSKPTPSD